MIETGRFKVIISGSVDYYSTKSWSRTVPPPITTIVSNVAVAKIPNCSGVMYK